MEKLQYYRAMEAFCRQRARMDGEDERFWLKEAQILATLAGQYQTIQSILREEKRPHSWGANSFSPEPILRPRKRTWSGLPSMRTGRCSRARGSGLSSKATGHQVESGPGFHNVYGFLTTAPNAIAEPIHPKARPVIPRSRRSATPGCVHSPMRPRCCSGRWPMMALRSWPVAPTRNTRPRHKARWSPLATHLIANFLRPRNGQGECPLALHQPAGGGATWLQTNAKQEI